MLAGDSLQQILRALERQLGIAVLRFELRDIGLVVLHLGLKWRLLEEVKEIALFDLGALDKLPLFEKGCDPRDERHPPDRLNATDKLIGLGDLLPLGAHDPDRRRPAGRWLRPGCDRSDGENEGKHEAFHAGFIAHLAARRACGLVVLSIAREHS